jgi:hypothetical protein
MAEWTLSSTSIWTAVVILRRTVHHQVCLFADRATFTVRRKKSSFGQTDSALPAPVSPTFSSFQFFTGSFHREISQGVFTGSFHREFSQGVFTGSFHREISQGDFPNEHSSTALKNQN